MFKIPTALRGYFATHYIFIVIALVFGIAFIKTIPPLWGIDEVTHFARVYQLSGGHLLASELPDGGYGHPLPTNLISLNTYVYKDLIDNKPAQYFYQKQDVDSLQTYHQLAAKHFNTQRANYSFTGAAIYSPFAYVGSLIGLIGARIAHVNIGDAITWARLGTLLVYIALVALALKILQSSKARWLVFVLALLPESLFQASIVNVDSIVIGESLLLFAAFLRLWSRDQGKRMTKWLLILIAILAITLPLGKPNYYILLLPVLFLPARLWSGRRAMWIYKAGTLLAGAVLLAIWLFATQDASQAISLYTGPSHNEIDAVRQAKYMLLHPFNAILGFLGSWVVLGGLWTQNFFGTLGWDYVSIPMVIVVLLLSLLVLAGVYAQGSLLRLPDAKKLGLALIAAGILTAISIVGVFYLTFVPVGTAIVGGVQGRYFIPAAASVLAGAGLLIRASLTMPDRIASTIFISVCVFSLATSFGVYYSVLY